MPVLASRKAKERQCFAVLLLRHLKSGKSRLSMPRSSLIVLGMLAGLQGENRNRSLVERVSVFFFGWASSSRRRDGFQARTAPHCCASPFLPPEARRRAPVPKQPAFYTGSSPDLAGLEKNNTMYHAILYLQSKTLFAKPIYCGMILQKMGEMAYVVFN